MRRALLGHILCLWLFLLLTACAVNENFVFDTKPLEIEILNSPKQSGTGNDLTKTTELTLPIAAPAVSGNVANGLLAITGNSLENGKIKTKKNRIVLFDVISDQVIWSATGNYSVSGLYKDLLILRKGVGVSYLGLHPQSALKAFNVTGEPRRYKGLEDLLIVSRADSILCFDSQNGALKWMMKGAKSTWTTYHYVKDRKLILYGDQLQVIDVDTRQQWNMPVQNTKVHTAEAMAINAGLCLLSSCAGAATGTYYHTDYVEPRVTHSLGATPVFTKDTVIFADATTITMCDLEDGKTMWQHTFSPEIEPSTVILSVQNDLLLTTFTGKKFTDEKMDTIADPQFKLLDARSGEILWTVKNSRADHPRDVFTGKDRSYLLYKTELRMYDEADTLIAASNCGIDWGEFHSFEYRPELQRLVVYCSMGILEADANSLQEITFTPMPAESMEGYAKKYPSYEAFRSSAPAGTDAATGKDGLKSITYTPGFGKITIFTTFEGDY